MSDYEALTATAAGITPCWNDEPAGHEAMDSRPSILLVDDDDTLQDLYGAALEPHYRVALALSTAQEDYMAGILKAEVDHLLTAHTDVFDVQNQLSTIVQELQSLEVPATGADQAIAA